MPNVLTIPSSAPFAQTLVRGLIGRLKPQDDPLALSRATIYLPTRRAVRNLAEVFARELGGAALLPEMRPLGDIDEDEAFFDEAFDDLDLPPAIAPVRRRLLLAALVRQWDKAQRNGTITFAQAASLAGNLANFFDEAQTQGVDLSKLDGLVEGVFAAHWDEVRKFLQHLYQAWPAILEADNAIDPADRRNRVLQALAKRLKQNPPQGPVIAAGSTGSIPATAALLRAIAALPNGSVVLPGLDRDLDDASWDELEESHPQYGMKQLLARMEIARADVRDWTPAADANAPREFLLRETLRPAPTTDAWRTIAEKGSGEIAKGLDGLGIVEAAHPGEEALAIALVLRETLETPKKTAALVTPDRNLARRVAAEMRRWNIDIDDSAGRPLANTPPGTFLTLIAETVDAKFAPVPLLAVLKHPLCSGGSNTAEFRRHVRELDRFALRGPRPDPGLKGISRAIEAAARGAEKRESPLAPLIASLAPFFDGLCKILRPLEDAFAANEIHLGEVLPVHIETAQRLAATEHEDGASILWRGEAGNAAATFAAALAEAANGIPAIEASSYAVLFRALAETIPVRPVFGRHPRLAILGPLEARLQSFDVTILGGLNEGAWPRAAATDPWLSRPMREKLGLEQPERAIGLSAHDFAALASGPHVVLTRAQKAEGSPTIPSRWLQRLKQLTHGLGIGGRLSTATRYENWARELSEPAMAAQRMTPPRPKPPIAQRPRKLSVTEIETWLRDPYAIYAKHVLQLRPLDPLNADIGPLERGTAVHAALEKFLAEFRDHLPQDSAQRLIEISHEVFREAGIPRATLAVWQPRFDRAAQWFVGEERARRTGIKDIHLEIRGEREFAAPGGVFILRCRADRIDILKSGGGAIVDYKTGKPPSDKQVKTLSPQLPLEASILAAGGFEGIQKTDAEELIYVRFSGDADPGELRWLKDVPALLQGAEKDLTDLIALFDDADHPYLSRIRPYRADQPGNYDHLARVREWSLTGWEAES
jgi:ATP-dependent helicase/nuclease subunit B